MNAPAPIIRVGHVIDELAGLPEGSVQCTVTSPPYWGLRDYSRCGCATKGAWEGAGHNYGLQLPHESEQGGALRKTAPDPACPRCHGTGKDDSLNQVWDATEGCAHEWGAERVVTIGKEERNARGGVRDDLPPSQTKIKHAEAASQGAFCLRCPAWRGQLGLEPTPDLYVQHIVQVFRGVWRAMRDDGVLWLNLGDSMSTGENGIRPKNLMGMPWRVAFALQEDGWNLRSAPVLAKRNPMPESDDSRPTSSYEMFFLLTKSVEPLFWVHRDGRGMRTHPDPDYVWVLEEDEYALVPTWHFVTQTWVDRSVATGRKIVKEERDTPPEGWHPGRTGCCADYEEGMGIHEWGRVNLWEGKCYFYDADAVREKGVIPAGTLGAKGSAERFGVENVNSRPPEYKVYDGGRNLRNVWWTDVWDVTTRGYPGAHFATFNPDWIRKPILAATSEKGCCATCGAAWGRIVERTPLIFEYSERGKHVRENVNRTSLGGGNMVQAPSSKTLGFAPTCEHAGEPVPCVVLDPFGGSGTTAQVARELGRAAVVIEVKEEYVEMIRKRARTEDEERYDEQRERGVAALESFHGGTP